VDITFLFPSFKEFFYAWHIIKTCACVAHQIVTQFKMQGVNTALYYKNKEMEDTFNIVPTSALRFNL
jgi:translation initiation factor IF-2